MTDAKPRTPEPDFFRFVRPGEHGVWRVLGWIVASVAMFALGLLVVPDVLATFAPQVYAALLANKPLVGPDRLTHEALIVGCIALAETVSGMAILALSRLAFRRATWTFAAPIRPLSPGLLAWGGLSGLLIMAGTAASDLAMGGAIHSPILDPAYPIDQRAIYALGAAPCLLLIAAIEEILFRGVLLQVTSGLSRNKLALSILNGVIFALSHSDPSPSGLLARTLLGAVWTWSVLELGGLEFAIGAHFIDDWMDLLLTPPPTSALGKPIVLTVDATEAVAMAIMVAVSLSMVWLIKRWRLRRSRPL